MHDHPQVSAFCQAAELMRDQRYWCRNDDNEIDFLRALADVVREVSYHLDAAEALNPDGLAAYCRIAGLEPWGGNANAELVLMTAVEAAVEQRTYCERATGAEYWGQHGRAELKCGGAGMFIKGAGIASQRE